MAVLDSHHLHQEAQFMQLQHLCLLLALFLLALVVRELQPLQDQAALYFPQVPRL